MMSRSKASDGSLPLLAASFLSTLTSAISGIYFWVFVEDFQFLNVPTVNYRQEWARHFTLISSPYLNNILLVVIFGAIHSGLSRTTVRSLITGLTSDAMFRSIYAICSSVSMFLMGFLWSPITIHIWAMQWDLIGYIVLGLNTCWWLMMILSLSFINAVEFGGADTLVEFLFGKKKKQPNYPPQLITTGMYGYVRHPVYFFLLCGIWLVPLMTVGHMILAAGLTLYIVVAVNLFEEAKLIEEFGESYRKYQRDVPYQFIPLIL